MPCVLNTTQDSAMWHFWCCEPQQVLAALHIMPHDALGTSGGRHWQDCASRLSSQSPMARGMLTSLVSVCSAQCARSLVFQRAHCSVHHVRHNSLSAGSSVLLWGQLLRGGRNISSTQLNAPQWYSPTASHSCCIALGCKACAFKVLAKQLFVFSLEVHRPIGPCIAT